ncbi:MAG: hypothetical protein EPN47_06505 [Acidobacteria bacterium]|nr:MAG: hypothetical protein EPN47_06505 [Acidobacteriota bacterium]
MSNKQRRLTTTHQQSPRHRDASLKNLEKAWQASRSRWEFTPARRAASRWSIKKAHFANRLPGRAFSSAQREAASRNVAKAREALKARGRSPEHLAKLRQSIAKARAARTRQSIERQAEKILKHGLFARRLRGPVAALGENPRDYQAIHRLVARYFGPQSEEEKELARLIADSLWRQHRIYFAQAAWQLERINFFLSQAPPIESTDANETKLRAYTLLTVLLDRDKSHRRATRLIGATERLLRRYLRLRFGRDPNFQTGQRLLDPIAGFPGSERFDLASTTTDPELFDELLGGM